MRVGDKANAVKLEQLRSQGKLVHAFGQHMSDVALSYALTESSNISYGGMEVVIHNAHPEEEVRTMRSIRVGKVESGGVGEQDHHVVSAIGGGVREDEVGDGEDEDA
ncbi:hypothetical protein GW17_00029314 [Ensete ventricosum]|nr:hypothetical protein GW17_00029314 [Ensete ventricosum]